MSNSQGPGGWNPYDDFAAPHGAQNQYVQPPVGPAPVPPVPPQPSQSGGNALWIVLGVIVVALVAVSGVLGGMLLGDRQPEDPLPLAADSSSSSAESTEAQTYTETETYTQTEEQGRKPRVTVDRGEPRRSSTSRSEASSSVPDPMFFGPGISAYLDSVDEAGWLDSPARCGNGYYARNVVKLESGKVVICENHSQDRYYIGDFPSISSNPDAYEVVEYRNGYILAENEGTEYEVTQDQLTVYSDGEELASHTVVAFGTLSAG